MNHATTSSASPAQYHIRWRGTQRGPYTAEHVLELLQQGQVSMYHEVTDGTQSLTVRDLQESVEKQQAATEELAARQRAEAQQQRQMEYEAQIRQQAQSQMQAHSQAQAGFPGQPGGGMSGPGATPAAQYPTPPGNQQASSWQSSPSFEGGYESEGGRREPQPADAVGAFVQRLFRANFYTTSPTQAESEALNRAGAGEAALPIRNYIAWRRTLLTMSAILLSVICIWNFVYGFVFITFTGSAALIKLPLLLLHLGSFAVVGLLFAAAINWSRYAESKRYTQYALGTVYFGSLGLLVFGLIFHFSDTNFEINSARAVYCSPFILAAFATIFLMPFTLIKVSMTIKKLLPQSSAPGWIVLTILPPYFCLSLIALAGVVMSAFSNKDALPAIIPYVFIAGAFYIILHNSGRFFRSMSEGEAFQFISSLQLQYLLMIFLSVVSAFVALWISNWAAVLRSQEKILLSSLPETIAYPVFGIAYILCLYYGVLLMLYVAITDLVLRMKSNAIASRHPISSKTMEQNLESLATQSRF